MSALDFVIRKIAELRIIFQKASFGYFANPQQTNHFIVTENIDLYSDDDFVNSQFEIINEFYEFYPNESISFISIEEKSLLKGLVMHAPIRNVGNSCGIQKWLKSSFQPKETYLASDKSQTCKIIPRGSESFTNNYPLAA